MTERSAANLVCRGYFDIPDDEIEVVMAGYAAHVAASRAEPGNLAYDFHRDPEIPGRVHVSEVYVDRSAFEAHLARTAASPWPGIRRNVALHIDVFDSSVGTVAL